MTENRTHRGAPHGTVRATHPTLTYRAAAA